MQLLKDKPYLWPVFVVIAILAIAVTIGFISEREKAKKQVDAPKNAPKNERVETEVLKPKTALVPQVTAQVGGPVSCTENQLYLNAPPLPPLKLYTRMDNGAFVGLTCPNNVVPTATNIIDQKVQQLETKVKELEESLEQLRKQTGRSRVK